MSYHGVPDLTGDAHPHPGLLDICTSIAGELRLNAVRCSDNSLTWLDASRKNSGRPVPLGPHLYGGTAGIALFLAALHRITGDLEHRTLALQTLSPLRQKLTVLIEDPARTKNVRLGIGGMIGLGSFLYTLVRVGRWLDDPSVLEEALRATALLSPERIEQDELLDVVAGSAGAILALLTLHDALPPDRTRDRASALDLAMECGHHLVTRRVRWNAGPRAWPPGPGATPLSGFAHGAAGICYALARLSAKIPSPSLLDAIEEGLAFERQLFSAEHGNWRDLRRPEPRFMTAWCHGAPGIALGRLGMLDVLDDPTIRGEIHTALETTRRFPIEELDHLCCGNCGRAEILYQAAHRLGEPSYREAADLLLAQVLARARERDRFFLTGPGEAPSFQPALLRGISGIGFSLLHRFSLEILSSPLLLN